MSGDAKEIVIHDEEDDDDRTIRNKAEELGVDVGNRGKQEVAPVAENDADEIIATGMVEEENPVADDEVPLEDTEPTDSDILGNEPEDLDFISKKFVGENDDDFTNDFGSDFGEDFGDIDLPDDENLKFPNNDDFSSFGDDYDNF